MLEEEALWEYFLLKTPGNSTGKREVGYHQLSCPSPLVSTNTHVVIESRLKLIALCTRLYSLIWLSLSLVGLFTDPSLKVVTRWITSFIHSFILKGIEYIRRTKTDLKFVWMPGMAFVLYYLCSVKNARPVAPVSLSTVIAKRYRFHFVSIYDLFTVWWSWMIFYGFFFY